MRNSFIFLIVLTFLFPLFNTGSVAIANETVKKTSKKTLNKKKRLVKTKKYVKKKYKRRNPRAKHTIASIKKSVFRSAPELLCGSDGYFRSCYKVTEKKCQRDYKMAFTKCLLHSFRGRKVFRSDRLALKVARSAGYCAGVRMEKKWKSKKSSQVKCKNPDQWP